MTGDGIIGRPPRQIRVDTRKSGSVCILLYLASYICTLDMGAHHLMNENLESNKKSSPRKDDSAFRLPGNQRLVGDLNLVAAVV